jgi:hypothetical protein
VRAGGVPLSPGNTVTRLESAVVIESAKGMRYITTSTIKAIKRLRTE